MVIIGMAAVFGGAARVPIATMLMVAEMTGGYALLVPAGLAVLLSYIVQYNLSRFVKYPSLYEAQVVARPDSPAHQAEQVQTAIRLLDHGGIAWPTEVTHLHLASLLQAGLALDLPDGSQLTAGVLLPESPWTGRQVQSRRAARPHAPACHPAWQHSPAPAPGRCAAIRRPHPHPDRAGCARRAAQHRLPSAQPRVSWPPTPCHRRHKQLR
jgi:hypothetical protein